MLSQQVYPSLPVLKDMETSLNSKEVCHQGGVGEEQALGRNSGLLSMVLKPRAFAAGMPVVSKFW